MKTLTCFLLMLFMVTAPPAWAGDSAATASEDHLLFNTMKSAPDARLEGRFRQQKTLEDIGATLESRGVFSFSVEKGLHWLVREPVATELRITREEIVEIQDGEEVMRMATKDQPMTRVISEIFFSMFTGDRDVLENYFELSEYGSANRWTLQLSPMDDTVASVMESIELQGAETVQEMTLRETNGDITRILLEDVRLSQP